MTSEAKIVISASNQTKGAFDQVKAGLGEMQASATNLVGNFALVGTAIAGAFAAANLKQTINTLDALDDFSEKSGIAVESLSALRFAGEVTGTSFESLQARVIKLSKNIAEAAAGGKEAQAAFDAIGVSVKNADGSLRNTDDVIADLAERFAGYKDGAGKAALAQELFGRSGADLIPILNQGRNGLESLKEEARALGAVYSGETAKAAATFNDDLKKLALSSEGLKVELLGGLIPAINKLLEGFLSVKKNGQLGTLLNPFAGIGNFGKQSEDYAADVAKASAEVERLQELLRTGPAINRTFVADRLREATQQLNAAQETYLNVQRNFEKANPSPETLRFLRSANQGPKVDAPLVKKSDSAGADQGKAFLENLQKQVVKLNESEFSALRLEAAQKGVKEQAEKYIVQLEAAKRVKEQLADFEKSALETERQRVEADKVLNDALLSLAESAQKVNAETALFGKTETQIKRITELKQLDQAATRALANATGEDVNTIIQAWDRAKAALENALASQESQSKIQEGLEKVRQSAEQTADRITSYLADALNADDPLKSLKKSFERELLNMALSPALTTLRDALASVFKQSGGGPGSSGFLDFLGSLFGNSGGGGGGFGGADLGGFFANGGNPPLGKVSVVGERGPEFFVPRTQGTIVPMEKVGGVSVNNVYNFSQGTTRAELIAVAEQTRKATIADVQQMFARNNPRMAA